MPELGLAETIGALRRELAVAAAQAATEVGTGTSPGGDIRFEVGQVQVELHVGVTRETAGKAGMNFVVVELGGDTSYRREEIQRVLVTLEAPTDATGAPIRVTRDSALKP